VDSTVVEVPIDHIANKSPLAGLHRHEPGAWRPGGAARNVPNRSRRGPALLVNGFSSAATAHLSSKPQAVSWP
jgi:hypothetical protein